MSVSLVGGYTVVTPAADSRVVYVSSLNGNDGNDGLSPATALKSISKGKALLRNEAGDQLLLEKGSVFTSGLGYWRTSGKSPDQPLLVGTYGTGARPTIANGTTYAFGAGSGSAVNALHDVVIQGIRFYAAERDPKNPSFSPAAKSDGFYISGNVSNMTFEDLSVEYFKNNFVASPYYGPLTNFTFRSNNISDAWSDYTAHSQGMYLQGIDGLLLDGNTLDHNGWNEEGPSAKPTVFNHGMYVQGTNRNVVARNNIISNSASHGLQMRAGGIVENNLFLNNPIGLSFGLVNGGGPLVPGGVDGVVKDNVFIGGRNIGTQVRGIGMEIANVRAGANVTVEKNIFTTAYEGGKFAAINVGWGQSLANGALAAGINDLTIKDNIVYKWTRGLWLDPSMSGVGVGNRAVNNLDFLNNDFQETTSSNLVYAGIGNQGSNVEYGSDRYYSSNAGGAPFYMAGRTYSLAGWFGAVEPTGEAVKATYVDPGRDMTTYSYTLGGSGTLADFLAKARANSKDALNAGYTAPAANNYVRAGFVDRGDATPAIPGGYVSVPSALPAQVTVPPTAPGGGTPTGPVAPVDPVTPVTPVDPVTPVPPPPPPPPANNPGAGTPVPVTPPYRTVVGSDGKIIIIWADGTVATQNGTTVLPPNVPGVVTVNPTGPSTGGGGLSYGGGYWYIP